MSRKTRQNPEGLTLLYAMQTAPHYGKLHAPGKSQKMWTLIPAPPLINISPLWVSASFIGLPSGQIRSLFFWFGGGVIGLPFNGQIRLLSLGFGGGGWS